jgi:tyrosyl-tRNA synthetase
LPTFEIARGKLNGLAVTALAQLAGLTSSASEARRFIEGGGLRVNDVPVTDVKATLSPADITAKGVIKLSVGKKKHILVKPV